MTNAEIIAKVDTLPKLPVIMAKDMLFAQGWKASESERAAIRARADFYEEMGLDRSVNLRVVDVYTGAKIGHLVFNA
jgi:pantothenate kinase type III